MTVAEAPPKSTTISHWLANGLLLATLFPYLSPVPMKSDIQPVAALIGLILLLFLIFVDRVRIKLTKPEIGLFLAGLVYLVYASEQAWSDPGEVLRKSSAMMLGFVIYLASKTSYQLFSSRVVMVAALGHLGAAFMQSFSPDLHKTLLVPFMSEVRGAEDRGVGGACSEPSFLANIGVMLPILAWVVAGNGNFKISKGYWLAIWFVVIALIGLSLAATAAIYGIVVLIVFGLSRGLKSGVLTGIATIGACATLIAASPSLPNTRATELITVAAKDPRLIIEDPSASMRLVGHYLSAPSLLEKPFGTGDVKLDQGYFWFLWNKYNLDSWYEIEVSRMSGQYYAIGYGLTDFGAGCIRMGWIFLAILAFWFWQYRGTKFSWTVVSFASLGVLSSIPIVFPAYWLMLGCVQAARERDKSLTAIPNSL